MPKQPQDHRRKTAKRLRDEATSADPMETLLGRVITIDGRAGSVDVTVLEDPLDWTAEVGEILAGWSKAGGIIVGEVIPLLKGIVSVKDARRIDQVQPTQRSARDLVDVITGADGDDDSLEDQLGESEAS